MSERTLRNIREAAGKTLDDGANALGISRPAYWRKEAGERMLRVEEARVLAELYSVPVEDIVFCARVVTKTGASDGEEVLPSA